MKIYLFPKRRGEKGRKKDRVFSSFFKQLFKKEIIFAETTEKILPNPLTCGFISAIIIKLNLFSQNNMLIWLSW